MKEKNYDREKARQYAEKWAYTRNPSYYNFDKLGGDCTNFVSQCIYEGSKVMNYEKEQGWFYQNINQRAPSWTGVEFLHQFLVRKRGVGPYGIEVGKEEIEKGDIVQLSFDGKSFTHSLFVVGKTNKIYVATHTYDSYGRTVDSYTYDMIRYLHIQGVRI